MENVALWHERDISHSSVERVIIPDGATVVHYMARCLRVTLEGLKIDEARMKRNIDLTRGLVYSQKLMLCLMDTGWERRKAYEKVQHLAGLAVSEDRDLKAVVRSDEEIMAVLGTDSVDGIFNPDCYIKHAHQILIDAGII
jgi:adenylosuccinate lyase